jgi:hypothetical protein
LSQGDTVAVREEHKHPDSNRFWMSHRGDIMMSQVLAAYNSITVSSSAP